MCPRRLKSPPFATLGTSSCDLFCETSSVERRRNGGISGNSGSRSGVPAMFAHVGSIGVTGWSQTGVGFHLEIKLLARRGTWRSTPRRYWSSGVRNARTEPRDLLGYLLRLHVSVPHRLRVDATSSLISFSEGARRPLCHPLLTSQVFRTNRSGSRFFSINSFVFFFFRNRNSQRQEIKTSLLRGNWYEYFRTLINLNVAEGFIRLLEIADKLNEISESTGSETESNFCCKIYCCERVLVIIIEI